MKYCPPVSELIWCQISKTKQKSGVFQQNDEKIVALKQKLYDHCISIPSRKKQMRKDVSRQGFWRNE